MRVSAYALGENLPRRDLWLSPDHVAFVDDVPFPVRHLINGATTVLVPKATVIHCYIGLTCLDVLLAEGLPSEPYLDTGDRASFDNGCGLGRLHPQFGMQMREA